MGVLSSSVSIARYTVQGDLKEPMIETIREGLKQNTIPEIEDDIAEKIVASTASSI